MVALIDAAKADDFPAEIALVVSNDPAAQGLDRARAAGIATAIVDHRPYGKDRAAFERALQAAIEPHRIDLICLAGFMRLLTPGSSRNGRRGCSISIRRCCPPSRASTPTRALSPPAPSSTAQPCISSCPKWIPARSSCRRRCRCCRTTPKPRSPLACSRSSIGFIRRRCGWSRKAAPAKAVSGRNCLWTPPPLRAALGLNLRTPNHREAADGGYLRRTETHHSGASAIL